MIAINFIIVIFIVNYLSGPLQGRHLRWRPEEEAGGERLRLPRVEVGPEEQGLGLRPRGSGGRRVEVALQRPAQRHPGCDRACPRAAAITAGRLR